MALIEEGIRFAGSPLVFKGAEDVKKFYFAGLVCLAAAAVFFAFRPRLYLIVRDESGRVRYAAKVDEGQQFTVRFVHSVALRPVDEIYTVRPDGIQVTATDYDMTGAGLPAEPLPGQKFEISNGKFHITGFTTVLKTLTYRVARVVANHRFIMNGAEHRLSEWGNPGRPVTFSVIRTSPLFIWRGF